MGQPSSGNAKGGLRKDREHPGQRCEIVPGRKSGPAPGRRNKGDVRARWQGLLALVEILLKLKPGDPVGQRRLSKRLRQETKTYYAPNTVGNYLDTIERFAKQQLFQRPEPHSGDPTILRAGVTESLNRAKKIIETNLDLFSPG